MVHTGLVVLIDYRGSLPYFGTFAISDSLSSIGALSIHGSLVHIGTLSRIDSLCFSDAFNLTWFALKIVVLIWYFGLSYYCGTLEDNPQNYYVALFIVDTLCYVWFADSLVDHATVEFNGSLSLDGTLAPCGSL